MSSPVRIYQAWCKKCGICVEFCPKKVFEQKITGEVEVKHPEKCIRCKQCEYRCPDFAIKVTKE